MSSETQEKVICNGVDVTALGEVIGAIEQDKTIAEFTFRADNKWIEGALNRTTIKDFKGGGGEQVRDKEFVVDNDEPPVLLGKDTAVNPVEWLLHAIAGCITTTTIYHGAARGIKIDEMSIKLSADLDLRGLLDIPGSDRPGYTGINMDVTIKGDASAEDLKELVEFAKTHSPSVDVINNGTPVNLTVNAN